MITSDLSKVVVSQPGMIFDSQEYLVMSRNDFGWQGERKVLIGVVGVGEARY